MHTISFLCACGWIFWDSYCQRMAFRSIGSLRYALTRDSFLEIRVLKLFYPSFAEKKRGKRSLLVYPKNDVKFLLLHHTKGGFRWSEFLILEWILFFLIFHASGLLRFLPSGFFFFFGGLNTLLCDLPGNSIEVPAALKFLIYM